MGHLVFRAYGRLVGVEGSAEALALVRERLPASYRAANTDPEVTWSLERRDDAWTTRGQTLGQLTSHDLVDATELLLSDLELWVAEHARRRIFIHAGCIVASGRAIVLPSATLGGKTSLTVALIRAGATYYSDEFAVLDAHGRVYPYPRTLSVRPYDGGPAVRRSAAMYGAATGRGAAPVGLLAFLRYDPAQGWDVSEQSAGEAAMTLLQNTVAARTRPRAALAACAAAAASAAAISGTRADADDAAHSLLQMLNEAAN